MNHVNVTASNQWTDRRSFRSRAPVDRGFALIVCLIILVVLTLLAVTGLRSSIIEEMTSGNQKLAASALFGAEQGVSAALDELFAETISDTDTGSEDDVNWSENGSTSGTGYSADYCVRHLVSGDDDYECPPNIAPGGTVVRDDDGRRYFIIDSTGETDSGEARRMVQVGIALEWGAASNIAGLVGCQGVTGLSNVVTGSYSSTSQPSNGDRGDIATTDSGALLYLVGSSDMDVSGEVRSTGAIYMDSDALVRRDALANLRITVESGEIRGAAFTNDAFYGCTSSSCVHLGIHQGPSVTPIPLVPYPACDPWDIEGIFADASSIKFSNHNGEIGISSDPEPKEDREYLGFPPAIGLPGVSRDYYFYNFTLDGKSIVVNGDVRIYVDNDFTMKSVSDLTLGDNSSLKVYVENGNTWIDSESKVNQDPANFFWRCVHPEDDQKINSPPAGCPINMWLYSKLENTVKDHKVTSSYDEPNVWDDSQDVAGVKIDSNSVFHGIIYAPLSHVVLGSNIEVLGSVRGRFVTGDSNFTFGYDEDLDQLWTGSPSDYKLVYWTEKYPE